MCSWDVRSPSLSGRSSSHADASLSEDSIGRVSRMARGIGRTNSSVNGHGVLWMLCRDAPSLRRLIRDGVQRVATHHWHPSVRKYVLVSRCYYHSPIDVSNVFVLCVWAVVWLLWRLLQCLTCHRCQSGEVRTPSPQRCLTIFRALKPKQTAGMVRTTIIAPQNRCPVRNLLCTCIKGPLGLPRENPACFPCQKPFSCSSRPGKRCHSQHRRLHMRLLRNRRCCHLSRWRM
jgi:hypothetical protein